MNYATNTDCCVISCNTSYSRLISKDILVSIFQNKANSNQWLAHLDTFFNEVPEPLILGFMQENQLTIDQLDNVFQNIPSVLQGKKFKELKLHARTLANPI